jgi:GTPase involved in cell partitioning and DNA repair
MKKNLAVHSLIQGALWGVGVLIVVGIGIISFNHLNPTEVTHGVSEINTTNEIDNEAIQQNIANLQNELQTLTNDTTQAEAILQLNKEI